MEDFAKNYLKLSGGKKQLGRRMIVIDGLNVLYSTTGYCSGSKKKRRPR